MRWLKQLSEVAEIKALLRHTLYLRLVLLLFCVLLLIIMMQVGSLFLLDYIPGNQSAMRQLYAQKFHWQVLRAEVVATPQGSRLPGAGLNAGGGVMEFSWFRQQLGSRLPPAIAHLEADTASLLNTYPQAEHTAGWLQAVDRVLHDYDRLAEELQHDVEVKQSVIGLLQLVSGLLLVCCLFAVAFKAKHLLIDRIGHLAKLLPQEFQVADDQGHADEFARLEQTVFRIAARLEGFKAESAWFNQTRSERLRRLLRAQGFLHRLVGMINTPDISEALLRKVLYMLESTLDVQNVALLFAEKSAGEPVERMLFSQHAPHPTPPSLLAELNTSQAVSYQLEPANGEDGSHCLVAAFTGPWETLGMLMVEAEAAHVFDETDIELVEMTAQLLSMVMGTQNREQEGRRAALLDERAAIARELHDSLAQSLSFMKIQIFRLQSHPQTQHADLRGIVNELRQGLDNAYRELRELLSTFRVHMDVRGLGFAIQSAIDEFMQRSNLSIALDNRLVNCRLTVNEEFHILHVIREALSNIVRHSGASTVTVALVYQSNGSVIVTIDDDGIGYASKPGEPGHYGHSIMQERAYSLGGELAVLRRRTGGTRVRLVFTPQLAQ
ncbi:histidine kinase [Methylovorus menthalis]|uniref:histidine kinase n=1 Tax=Methylovorus menthalis TaxID=1002227 RepID=UPI001E564C97|nr:histidine kinase [Methylovorus menthalis]MCB4809724.1 histidine kinase [Methylovorus menthalis]